MKLSDLKAPPLSGSVGVACDKDEDEVPVVRRRTKKSPTAADGGETKIRGHRQRDFDPAAEEEVEGQENKEKVDSAAWTQNQQKLLELALQQFPRGMAERWDRIAKVVPGKTKVSADKRPVLVLF